MLRHASNRSVALRFRRSAWIATRALARHPVHVRAPLQQGAARLAHDLRRAEENNSSSSESRVKTKRQLREEEKARSYDQLRKDSLGAVYRRLVKELHPDREPDQAERERKSRIMQDITAAYT